MKFILQNIHTIILLVGLGLMCYGLFLLGEVFGYVGSGVILVLLATYIDKTSQ